MVDQLNDVVVASSTVVFYNELGVEITIQASLINYTKTFQLVTIKRSSNGANNTPPTFAQAYTRDEADHLLHILNEILGYKGAHDADPDLIPAEISS